MAKTRILAAAFLLAILVILPAGCDSQAEEASQSEMSSPPVVLSESPGVSGWMALDFETEGPVLFDTDDGNSWALFPSGMLLCLDASSGHWRSYLLDGRPTVVDLEVSDGTAYLLTNTDLVVYEPGEPAVVHGLPEGFSPLDMAVGDGPAVLGENGRLALLEESEFELASPEESMTPIGSLNWLAPDWVFSAQGPELVRVDPEVALWQREEMPFQAPVAVRGGGIFAESDNIVYRRRGPSEWTEVAQGRLYPDGSVLGVDGIYTVNEPGEPVATRPAIEPSNVMTVADGGPVWAYDDEGILAYSALGEIETRLPNYEMERITCTLAGQGPQEDTGSPSGVSPVTAVGGAAFRVYESVSSRPDPFTEFPPRRRDLRRPLEEISIEELRLVGITLDPVGGDQAMVEDMNGVPYLLYEDSELANNTHVAEITSNEVIVVQEVSVGTGEEGEAEASIPTIFSMRLHEEGGL
ncbi:hypothetical protein GF402_04575 [Candidatus Fermentibacteria bacterium]|nr:hypothetical protein [Candidatus Fermentibacteria bacterium]